MNEFHLPNYENLEKIKVEFLLSLLHCLDEKSRIHLTKCKTCNNKLAPFLIEIWNIMITDNQKFDDKMSEIASIIFDHNRKI